jgi:hypothetical protein
MANTHRYGFRFVKNRWAGDTPEVVTRKIASGYTPNVTGATTCNLNIGDPVYLDDSGNANLLVPGTTTTADDQVTQRCFGVIAGFPQMLINGAVRPNAFYPTGTVYGTNYNNRTLVTIIPAEGNVFEIDTDAAGSSSFDTRSEWESAIGGTAAVVYSQINTTGTNPKANPLFGASGLTQAVANFRQLRLVGVGAWSEAIDFTAANMPVQVVFNLIQAAPWRTTAGYDGT